MPTESWETNSTSLASLFLYWNVQNLLQKGVCKWTFVHTNVAFTNRNRCFYYWNTGWIDLDYCHGFVILLPWQLHWTLDFLCIILATYWIVTLLLRKFLFFLFMNYTMHSVLELVMDLWYSESRISVLRILFSFPSRCHDNGTDRSGPPA